VLLLLVVELGALAVLDNGLDRQSIVGGASVYPFGHNILLAARDAGLGGVMTTALARQEPAVKELLGIPDTHALAALLALGHPAKQVTKLRRAEVEDFTTVDRFDGPAFS
jgi:nitroreductase